MNKSFIVATLLVLSCFSGVKSIESANSNVGEILTGVWVQAGLTSPTAIIACFDPTTSANLLTLIGEVLTEASSGSLSVLTKIEQ